MTTMSKEGLTTPRAAAKYFDVTPRTVARWCRTGQLRAIKVGRVWRVCTFDGRPILEVSRGVESK